MHRLTSVLFAVACLYAQAETTKKATYEVSYDFTFSLKTGVTPTDVQINTAAQQALIGLQFNGASVVRTIQPTQKTISLNGKTTELWTTSFSCSIPNSVSTTQTTTAFTSKKFASDLVGGLVTGQRERDH